MMAAALAALALSTGPPSLQPHPIGVGRAYRPRPAPAAVRAGQPVGALRCTTDGDRFGVHVEVFAKRRVVIVPAGIGVARPYRTSLGTVAAGGCSYAMRTLTPTGVVEVLAGSKLTLAHLFRVWGQPLGPQRLVGFRGAVLAFVGGRRWPGDPRSIPLRRHAQIVLEVGGYVAPHPRFLFPGGL
jgi:hypothetical protein